MAAGDRDIPAGLRRLRLAGGALLAALLLGTVVARAGVTRSITRGLGERAQGGSPRRVLRVWDWWSPSTDEKYAAYFGEVEREFEALHPDVDLIFQYVPFIHYEQKMATGLVGVSPPDVFQSSVSWAEGFYDRGMLLPLNGFLERERAERERRAAAGETIDTGEFVEREAFLEAAWRHNTKPDGTVFGIPQILDSSCLIWNLGLLRKAAETDTEVRSMFLRNADGSVNWERLRFDAVRDWDQFRRITRKLTKYDRNGRPAVDGKGDEVQTGFIIHAHGGNATPFLPWCAANGSNFQDAVGTRALFADAAGVEAMQLLLDVYWKDRVTPAFRRQLTDEEAFNSGRIACMVSGTWAGKYTVRNTEGRIKFDLTPFPPGPRGSGHTALTWGNMLVISRRTRDPDLAWEYVKFITSLNGARRLLRHIEQNSPRKDFYESPDWEQACRERPYLSNIYAICASGKKLRNTQINAVDQVIQPVFESILLRYPEIQQGRGPYPSVAAGMQSAAGAVDRVYARYNAQVARWQQKRARQAATR